MTQTLTETNELKAVTIEQDTWLLALPAELCQREGLPQDTLASLTFRNGAIQADYIRPNPKAEQAAARFINRYGDFMKEMEKIGDSPK